MAVYTEVSDEELARFIDAYGLGELLSCKGIAEGVENTNYLVHTTEGTFILTIYEKRVDPDDLPFFLGLMEHLSARGVTCPLPVRDAKAASSTSSAGRHAALITFLEGMWPKRPKVGHCPTSAERSRDARCGRASRSTGQCARPRQAGGRFSSDLPRARRESAAALTDLIAARARFSRSVSGRRDLPQGVIHADLFPDNVFFLGDTLSGSDRLLFRLQRCARLRHRHLPQCLVLRAEFRFNATKGQALLTGYDSVRPLSAAERAAMPILARGAAMRFLLTRSFDWLNTPKDALVARKDPLDYVRRLRFHQFCIDRRLRAAS